MIHTLGMQESSVYYAMIIKKNVITVTLFLRDLTNNPLRRSPSDNKKHKPFMHSLASTTMSNNSTS